GRGVSLAPGASPRAEPGRARWVMRGLLLFALAFTNLNDIWSPDVLPNALVSYTVLREGDLDFDEFTGLLDRDSYFFRACGTSTATAPPRMVRSPGGPPHPGPDDAVCSIFPPGIGLLALPFFAPFVPFVPPSDLGFLVRMGHVAAASIAVLAALLLWSVLRRFTTERWALGLVLLYWLATSVRTVSAQALWQHAGVQLAAAAALWLVLRPEAVSLRREALAGALLGLGGLVRQTAVLVAPGLGGLGARRHAAALAGAALGLVPLLLYNALAFGSPLEQGYGSKPFDTPPALGLYGLLLSPSRGLFVYAPYLLAAIAALALAWRRPGLAAARLRTLSLAALATLVLYATYTEWWGGRVFGPRFLDDLAPILFAALAWGIGQGLLERPWRRIAFWAAAAWSLVLFQAAAFVYDPNGWDTLPANVNFAPQRLLDWTDPQWLAVLSAVPAHGERVAVAFALSGLVLLLLLRVEGVLASGRARLQSRA
ncbi:MAG TPA: hypothetical protein VMJ92_02375, partial [Candidatus Limnocylindrales bacterium]|nr:hypothetical protein [Candidatus Limnocylindrales bacterium]